MDDNLFLPDHDPTSELEAIENSRACILSFTEKFNDRDLAGMDGMLHFPHIILSGEKMEIWASPSRLPDDFFEQLSAATGWASSVYESIDPVLVSPRKVHFIVEYSRRRADQSIITIHKNLWVVTHEQYRWGIKIRSY